MEDDREYVQIGREEISEENSQKQVQKGKMVQGGADTGMRRTPATQRTAYLASGAMRREEDGVFCLLFPCFSTRFWVFSQTGDAEVAQR